MTTGSGGCTQEGTLLTSSIRYQSHLLESEHSDTCGARSACVVLISSLDWQSMDYWVNWMDRDSLLLEEDPWALGVAGGAHDWLSHWAPTRGHGCSPRASAYVGSNQASSRVKQGGPFKEVPRVLIGLALKETCCKNTPLKIDFTST